MPESLPESFERLAKHALSADRHVVHTWSVPAEGKHTLVFPVQCDNGFQVRAEAESYGLYAFAAEGWHSAAWELSDPSATAEAVAQDFLGFLRTLLSPEAELETHYAGRSPYKWVLRYRDESGWQTDTTGLFLFNYFGQRRRTIRRNTVLAARYEPQVAGAAQQ